MNVTVLTLANDAYAMPLAVMVRSLLENLGTERGLNLYVVDGGITAANRQRLEASWRDLSAWPRTKVRFVQPLYGAAESLPVWGRMSVLTYARLCIADYLPRTCGRALLLDSDLVVLTDIGRLADIALDGATVAATIDPFIPSVGSPSGIAQFAKLKLNPDASYFNAGIMLVDLERWRRDRVSERAFQFIAEEGDTLQQFDQDSLNVVLHGDWKQLDAGWQAHPRLSNALGEQPIDEAKILHFSGRLKPWSYESGAAEDRLFYEILDRTAWRGWRPPSTLTSWGLRTYDSAIRRALYPLERRLTAWWQVRARRSLIAPR